MRSSTDVQAIFHLIYIIILLVSDGSFIVQGKFFPTEKKTLGNAADSVAYKSDLSPVICQRN